jgi:hypothetical protein
MRDPLLAPPLSMTRPAPADCCLGPRIVGTRPLIGEEDALKAIWSRDLGVKDDVEASGSNSVCEPDTWDRS